MKAQFKHLIPLVLFFLFAWQGLYAGQDKELWRKVIGLEEAKNYQTAFEIINEAIENDNPKLEKKGWAYRFRGKMRFYLDQHEAAIKDVDKALEFNPSDAYAYFVKSLIYEGTGYFDKAVAANEEAIRVTKSENSKPAYEKNLHRLKSSYYILIADEARTKFSPEKTNKYLFAPPIDDAALKGKVLEWEGYHESVLDGHFMAWFPGIGHEKFDWAFTNPKGVDLTSVKKGWVRVIGTYAGRSRFSTLTGSVVEIPVLEVLWIENTTPTNYPTAAVFREGVN